MVALLLDSCEQFISSVDFSSHIQCLLTTEPLTASDAVAFVLRLAGHLQGIIRLTPVVNHHFADVVEMLFHRVVESDVWWSRARIRAAWLYGLQSILADGHPTNRRWLSAHGDRSSFI